MTFSKPSPSSLLHFPNVRWFRKDWVPPYYYPDSLLRKCTSASSTRKSILYALEWFQVNSNHKPRETRLKKPLTTWTKQGKLSKNRKVFRKINCWGCENLTILQNHKCCHYIWSYIEFKWHCVTLYWNTVETEMRVFDLAGEPDF